MPGSVAAVISRSRIALGALALTAVVASTSAAAGVNGAADVQFQAWRVDPPEFERLAPSERAGRDLADLVNQHRAERGLPGFNWNDQVASAALAHAMDMAEHERLNHVGSDGSTTGIRLERAGYRWLSWGENIGAGFVDPAMLLAAWLESEAHQQHLDGDLREIGVGVATTPEGVLYWALVLANPL